MDEITDLDNVRYMLQSIARRMDAYGDAELRDIKNTADVFSMHIRMELAARDARMVDEAAALKD